MAAMAKANINVLMITQASSEHSICIAVPHDQGEKALAALKSQFELELARSTINSVSLLTDMSVVAIIGEGMAFSPGVAGTFLRSLARARVNVRAIAQGSSERQIAVVVNSADATRALRSVHQAFTLSDTVVSVAVLGATGAVGENFMNQLEAQAKQILETMGIQIKIQVAASSTKMVWDDKMLGMEIASIGDALKKEDAEAMDIEKLSALVQEDINPHRIVIDMTNSDLVPDHYENWIKAGVHVIGHNKNMPSGDLSRYKSLKSSLRYGTAQYQYEGTVGGALPVLTMARDLMNTGDEVVRVMGCLSGTMAYTLKTFDESVPFSSAAKQALDKGYSHHDIAKDLSGVGAAKNLCIIAREIGMDLSLEDVEIESMLPAGFDQDCWPTDEEVKAAGLPAWKVRSAKVVESLKEVDATMLERLKQALAEGKVLRHVATIDVANKKATVGVQAVDNSHPLFRLKGDENLISYQTKRYDSSPLICKGASAGADLTATGVLADLLRLARTFTN
jgi:aspartokinase/homoserine dehydrogenase 1